MKTPHLILDYETGGQNVFNVPVFECSYLTFDWDRFINEPYSYEELLRLVVKDKLDVTDQVKRFGWKIEKTFIDGFLKTLPKDVQINFKPSDKDMKVEEYLDKFLQYAGTEKVKYWWSRSNTFDPIILDRLLISVNRLSDKDKLLPYWRVRDTRTFINAKSDFKMTTSFVPMKDEEKWKSLFKLHDSRHDIIADILRLQTITRIENDLELPE